MLCSELHCQKGFTLRLCAYKILTRQAQREQDGQPDSEMPVLPRLPKKPLPLKAFGIGVLVSGQVAHNLMKPLAIEKRTNLQPFKGFHLKAKARIWP